MKNLPTYVVSDHCKLPLGNGTEEVWANIIDGKTAVRKFNPDHILPLSYQAARWEHYPEFKTNKESSILEKLIIESIENATQELEIDLADPSVIFIGATTKGNIDLLEKNGDSLENRERPAKMGEFISSYFNNSNTPWMISNACVSGLVALETAHLLLSKNRYKHAVVFGGDLVTKFVMSGFSSFKAISENPCRPFDKNRSGISIGEGAATIVLSNEIKTNIRLVDAATSNDANHISGPSRDGAGLKLAIEKVLGDQVPDFISTHGTATPYNDEMEALAIHASGLEKVPAYSIKGNIGHTLGAAGLVESCILLESMRKNKAPGTLGFKKLGVSVPVNILKENFEGELNCTLKTASGFGGCNAAVLFEKS